MNNCYEKGGFKVPNIEYFCKALKISWVKRFFDFNEEAAKWKVSITSTT
jgi:transposase